LIPIQVVIDQDVDDIQTSAIDGNRPDACQAYRDGQRPTTPAMHFHDLLAPLVILLVGWSLSTLQALLTFEKKRNDTAFLILLSQTIGSHVN
jgi:hypothetical protein